MPNGQRVTANVDGRQTQINRPYVPPRQQRAALADDSEFYVFRGVNAGEKLHRRAGVKLHHGWMPDGLPREASFCLLAVDVG